MLDNRWAMLAVVFLTRTPMGLMFQSLAAVGPLMINDLHLTYSQYGLLFGLFFMLPGAAIALPGGLLGQRFGSRHLASGGLALMVAGGLVTAESHGFALAAIGRTLTGIGSALLNVAVAKMVADWFTGKEMPTAMGVMLTSFPVGMALAMGVLGHIGTAYTWRVAVHATALAAAVACLLAIALYRNPATTTRNGARPATGPMRGRHVALSASIGLSWGLFNAGFAVLGSFAPGYLVSRGTSVSQAGVIVSIGILVSLVSVPLGGVMAARIRQPEWIIVSGCVATALFIAVMPLLPAPALWFVLMGLAFGLPPGAMMSLLPHALPADRLSTGLGVFYTVFYLALAGAPPLAGLVRDLSGIPAAPIFCAAGATAASLLFLALFHSLELHPDGAQSLRV